MGKEWKSGSMPDETCNQCGTVYSVTFQHFPVKERDSFKCSHCGNLVKEWNDTKSFYYTRKMQEE
jgi:predicted Zn finger-like uncharacterized protein